MGENDRQEIMRFLSDWRESNAEKLGGILARLDAMSDHETRIRAIEKNELTRDDVEAMLAKAIESSRRPAWRDVGMLIMAISTSSGLVLAAARFIAG